MLMLATSLANAQDAKGGDDFTLGADISWYTEMADKGYSFALGAKKMSCPELVKAYGMNAARFRVWVNPEKAYNGKDDVVKKAKEAKAAGLDVMIDFHFSDNWADPSKQTVPAAWANDTYSAMRTHLSEHVKDVLETLVAEGVEPRWVQIGNETNDGMLWDKGRASSNPRQYAGFVTTGYSAVKAVCPDAQVIVHVSNGYDQGLFDWNIGELKKYGAQFDIIGMSVYPSLNEGVDMRETVEKAMANIKHLHSSFGKRVMIVETGLPVSSGANGKSLMSDIIDMAENQTDKACAGVLYWEPECPSSWNNYSLGAATTTNKIIRFTTVMEAFKEAGEALGVEAVEANVSSENASDDIYNLGGAKLRASVRGINIVKGKKVIVR